MRVDTVPVTANPKGKETAEFQVRYPFAESVEEAVELWGEEVVLSKVNQQTRVDVQAFIRGRACSKLEKDEQVTADDLQELLFDEDSEKLVYIPGSRRPTTDKVAKLREQLDALPEELRAALLADIAKSADEDEEAEG